jgi:AcrR family transcriptional regulator
MTKQSPRSRRVGRTAEKAEATRAELIDRAAQLFAEDGYLQTSIRELAAKSKVTTGAIYGHFRNKADLLAAAVNREMTVDLEGRSGIDGGEVDHVEVSTRLAREWPKRRRLRALILQGAAAAPTDAETREQLREEQLAHIDVWVKGYERERERLGIDPAIDLRTAVLFQWAAELGLGMLEAIDIEPRSRAAWADVSNRYARSWHLPPERPIKR